MGFDSERHHAAQAHHQTRKQRQDTADDRKRARLEALNAEVEAAAKVTRKLPKDLSAKNTYANVVARRDKLMVELKMVVNAPAESVEKTKRKQRAGTGDLLGDIVILPR